MLASEVLGGALIGKIQTLYTIREVLISDYLSLNNVVASYTCDFGNNWVHTVTL